MSNQRCEFQRISFECEKRYTTSKQRCPFQHGVSQSWLTWKQRCENDHFRND